MGRLFGILAIALLVWVGMEFYTKGSERAFGGIFAGWNEPLSTYESDPDGRSPTQRIGDKVRGDIQRGADRTLDRIPD